MKREMLIGMLPFYLLALIVCIGIASFGSDAVTAMKQSTPLEREYTVVIDPGHGGIDGGATSCTGVLESAFNLQIGLRLNDLMHLLGHHTVMIRTTDTSVYTQGNTIASQKVSDLKERVRIANETPGAILLSIHQNTFSDSRYYGAQVFYAESDGSRELAESLQSMFAAALGSGSDRKCKKASNVYLMQNIRCPGVLIECGFLSNPTEEAKLRQEDYQKKLCCVIACGLGEFLSRNG